MDAQVGVIQLWLEGNLESNKLAASRSWKRKGNQLSQRTSTRSTALLQPGQTHFGLLTSRTYGNKCAVLSHELCGILLQHQKETNTFFLIELHFPFSE